MLDATKLLLSLLSLFLIIDVEACLPSKPKQRCCTEIPYCFTLKKGLLEFNAVCPSTFSPYFTLFTRTSKSGVSIWKNNIPSAYSNNRQSVFIVHGWKDAFIADFTKMKDDLLLKDDYNVIGVDWKQGADAFTYFPSAANTETMGAYLGSLANILRKQPGSKPYFWCIGHSLGAHVCGHTKLTASPLLERITGLDPAGPGFGSTEGLTKTCALKVDAIHTDAVFGSIAPRGHVDFYPNGGTGQPGCILSVFLPGRSEDDLTDAERVEIMQKSVTERGFLGCSHSRAVEYMITSILKQPPCFVATHVCPDIKNINTCKTLVGNLKGVMGHDAINNLYTGNLYFKPSTNPPYCSTP